jgi:hypothetical protein
MSGCKGVGRRCPITGHLPVSPAPGPLEAFAHHFDSLFSQRSQRQAFRDYLAGLLLPAERNKTLTALANTEPIVGAHAAPAQRLQWFLTESTWDAEVVNRCRLAALRTRPTTAPDANGALVIDETGDRKDGERRRTSRGSIGKIDNGGVSVGALWADERVCYPVEECDAPATEADVGRGGMGRASPRPPISWPVALRSVRAWLELWTRLARYGGHGAICPVARVAAAV